MKLRFAPPGGLASDLDDREELLDAWSDAVDGLLEEAIRGLARTEDVQLFNPVRNPRTDLQPRPVPWITMPARFANHQNRRDALIEADAPAGARNSRENQPEYSEWFTRRDANGRVMRVDVTTELPEYWRFLGEQQPAKVLALYQTHVSPRVVETDLFVDGVYDPQNVWNSERGAMHMTCSINTLRLAIGVLAGGIIWRRRDERIVTDVQFCEPGSATENADPTLIAHANRLAREQRAITFANPPGIYILGLDLDGWKRPDGRPVTREDVVAGVRGTPAVRLEIEGRDFALWESTIDGEPVEWGSQIAERITVGPIAAVGPRERRDPKGDGCRALDGAANPVVSGRRP